MKSEVLENAGNLKYFVKSDFAVYFPSVSQNPYGN